MLQVYIIDDELPALQELGYLLRGYPELAVGGMFKNPLEAMKKMEQDKPDVVFLDIDMPNINGIELALKLQELYQGVVIVFVTAHAEFSLEAFRTYPLDYILKPVDEDRFHQTIRHMLQQHRLRQTGSRKQSTISLRCFGKLELSREGETREIMKLTNRKMRELFAYLIVHFGREVSRKELIDVLFEGVEDKKTINHLHVTVYNLRNMLESFGVDRSHLLIRESYTLEVAPGICDYIDFVNFINTHAFLDAGNVQAAEHLIESYQGPFLGGEDYIWVMETWNWLDRRFEALLFQLSAYYQARGQNSGAERHLKRLLEINPWSEAAHQALLDLYMQPSKAARYCRQYEIYAQMLEKELQVEPEEKYQVFYRRYSRRKQQS
ncbi:response regulator [Candidatus Formimonas warabiya]|uniref:Stage 0 sporulation protein A homolog n=1 Tax=Formimonas warabiya TaxID=1761012 RepID=A0A3G1KT85_FORW1|nr:response regulator [Candidatus Formimonas warabiya]ATW25614.1 hypothetical protein DCMF_13355 [Candidatus Formimonas warabiya]